MGTTKVKISSAKDAARRDSRTRGSQQKQTSARLRNSGRSRGEERLGEGNCFGGVSLKGFATFLSDVQACRNS